MSDNDDSFPGNVTSPAKITNKWTIEAEVGLLLQAMKQLLAKDSNLSIKTSEITLEGRTKKSIDHRWQELKRRAVSYDASFITAAVPQKRAKSAKKTNPVGDTEDFVEVEDEQARPSKKKARTTTSTRGIARKVPKAKAKSNKKLEMKVEGGDECSGSGGDTVPVPEKTLKCPRASLMAKANAKADTAKDLEEENKEDSEAEA